MKGVATSLSLMAMLSQAASSAILALWRLRGVTNGVHDIMRSWRPSRQAKDNDLEARVPSIGIAVAGSSVVR